MTKPHILTIVNDLDFQSGGPTRSITGLNSSVVKVESGIEINLFVAKVSQNQATGSNGIEASSEGLFPVSGISELAALIKKLQEQKPGDAVIHSHGVWLPVNHIASSCARRYDVPLVISPRGMLEPWAMNYHSWKKKLAWLLYQRKDLKVASVLHATAIEEAKSLRNLGFKAPIAILPNGINLPKFLGRSKKNEDIKTALFLSRIHPKKGLMSLVRAWDAVHPEGWKLVIAGPDEGGHQALVENEVSRLNLSCSVEFIGPVSDDDKWALYRDVDLTILPTFSENFGIVVPESLACEVPVITTKGTPWRVLEERQCGWWIDIGVEPLIKAIRQATSISPTDRAGMGKRGRLLVEEEYLWPNIASKMVDVYEWCLHGGTVPDCLMMD